jgi:hypothetical protein
VDWNKVPTDIRERNIDVLTCGVKDQILPFFHWGRITW